MDLEYEWFKKKIKELAGVDLQSYRPEQMKRLVEKQVEKAGVRSFVALVKKLEDDPASIQEFRNDMTINVSSLFRDVARWEQLKEHLPGLIERKVDSLKNVKEKPEIRVWSAGCSIGAEPYTIATMFEEMKATGFEPDFNYRVICSDIDRNMIDRARDGIYTDREMKNVPDDLKEKYFRQIDRPDRPWAVKSAADVFFKAVPALRMNLRFKVQNILEDGLERGLDLIMCRNVIIYFNSDVKEQLFRRFSRALVKDGILFIGATEVIFKPGDYQLRSLVSGLYTKIANGE